MRERACWGLGDGLWGGVGMLVTLARGGVVVFGFFVFFFFLGFFFGGGVVGGGGGVYGRCVGIACAGYGRGVGGGRGS